MTTADSSLVGLAILLAAVIATFKRPLVMAAAVSLTAVAALVGLLVARP